MIIRYIPQEWVLNLCRKWLKKVNAFVGGWASRDFKHIVIDRFVFRYIQGVSFHLVGPRRRTLGDIIEVIPEISKNVQEEEVKEAVEHFLASEENAIEQAVGLLHFQTAIYQGARITGELKREGDNEHYFLFTCYSAESSSFCNSN